jgi:hypothetical protein
VTSRWLDIGAAKRSKAAMQALVNSSFDKLDAEHAREAAHETPFSTVKRITRSTSYGATGESGHAHEYCHSG